MWNISTFPARAGLTLDIDREGAAEVSFRPEGSGRETLDCDVVWRRRIFSPLLSEELPAGDRQIARQESIALIEAALALAAPQAAWVNPPAAARAANMKPLQLRAAVQAGLRIPDTLCSNDPEAIRDFAARHRHRIIHKPFRPAVWRAEGAHYVAETALLDDAMLAEDFALGAAPGIYQPALDKECELRVAIMGETCLAAKLTLAGKPLLPVDIKPIANRLTAVEVELAPDLRRACLRLMRALGLIFGSIDLVVTPEGETLFLEINEGGQFLWVETLNPAIPVLSLFADFIATGRADFKGRARADGVSWDAYGKSYHYRRFSAQDPSIDADRPVSFLVNET
ncbi:MAG TPA: hypothetical protein VKT70_09915 [Stellaceae bacterium]|nr:hypothetical protein [Stellaceae bacterium]